MTHKYYRFKAGHYANARFIIQRFITDERTYWTVTDKQSKEQREADNFKQAKEIAERMVREEKVS